MSYEPNVQHKGAVQQIIDARQKALEAVSQVRQHRIETPHPNLAPSGEPNLPVIATQAVVDYLLHLRPYRASSRNWQLGFGSLELPKSISYATARRGGWNGKQTRKMWLCRQPELPVRNVSELIETLNMDVHYSTNRRGDAGQSNVRPSGGGCISTINYSIHPPGYPSRLPVSKETFTAVRQGRITAQEAVDRGLIKDDDDEPEDEPEHDYTPAIPEVDNHAGDTRGADGKLETYKIVFGPDRLIHLVELADEVAAEVDMLAEIEPPDHSSSGGDAI